MFLWYPHMMNLGHGVLNGVESELVDNFLRRILLVVQARNKKYYRSSTFSITVDVPQRNVADNLPQFLNAKKSSYISD